MSQKEWSNKTWKSYMIPLAALASAVLLFVILLANRSLFLDGINLARNVAEASFVELTQPLKYEQSAPILFLFLAKIITSLFGISEYSLRLIPFLSAFGCLYFFTGIMRRLVSKPMVAIALFWLGTHSMFVRYATEFKQYMTDALITVFLIWLVLQFEKFTIQNLLYLGFVGALCIWLSMPSIFILFGILCYAAVDVRKSKRHLLGLVLLGLWYAFHLYAEYHLILRAAISSDHMQNYHQPFFLQGKFWNLESLSHDLGLIIANLRMAVGKSALAIGVGFLLIALGLWDFIKRKRKEGLLLALPIFAVYGASLIGKYSLIERLMLFTLPLIFFLIFYGVNILLKYLSGKKKWIQNVTFGALVLSFIIGYSQTQGLKYLITPMQIEDNKSALQYISQHEAFNHPIICTQLAYPAYDYYTKKDIHHKNNQLSEAIGAKYGESVSKLALEQHKASDKAVWIFMAHMSEKEIENLINELDQKGEIKNSYRTKHSAAILFSTQ